MADPSRYEGISTAESAHRTCSAPASRSVYTATDRMPSAESVRMIRTAISPRLAIRTAENIGSHPEDAVADRLQRCVVGGGQGQAEDAAGVRRAEGPALPDPGGRRIPGARVVQAPAGLAP